MPRQPRTVRLSETERDVLKAAARREGRPYTRMIREAALDHAAAVLSREVPRLGKRGGEGEGDGE